jgi:hypothetical protein
METMSNVREKVFLGCPASDGRLDGGAAQGLYVYPSKSRQVTTAFSSGSLLCLNFNTIWCTALAECEMGTEWFAMLHSDIQPDPWWIDTLIDEAAACGADVMSATVPIKDMRGVTSTAIDNPADPWNPFCRLTLQQINHAEFPATFDAESAAQALQHLPEPLRVEVPEHAALLVNTGCFVARLNEPWASLVHFHTRDQIVMRNGRRIAEVQPEDWLFSRDVAALGGRVMATRKVRTIHKGSMEFVSNHQWGQPRDVDCERILQTQ